MKSCEVVYCSLWLSNLKKKYPVVCEVPIFSSLVCACLRLVRTSAKHLLTSFQNQLQRKEANTKSECPYLFKCKCFQILGQNYIILFTITMRSEKQKGKQRQKKKKSNPYWVIIVVGLMQDLIPMSPLHSTYPPDWLPPALAIISNFQSSNKMKMPEKHQNHNLNV